MTDKDKTHEYLEQFSAYMGDVDELAQVILKGHLIIEGVLDNILELVFFHPEHLANARLSFNQKVNLARAYCLRKNQLSMWRLVTMINTIRNQIAHSLHHPKRDGTTS
jgi:hypothetical protein